LVGAQEFKVMKTLLRAAGIRVPRLARQGLAGLLSLALLFITLPANTFGQDQDTQQAPTVQQPPTAQSPQAPPYVTQTPEQLQDLVAPIALYPDSLVAQVLAASTFPEQVVEADRWVQAHPDLKGQALGNAVNNMPWDASVKALTAFPSVLGNMDKNLSWTSSLGDAYYNQPQDVMNAVQVMRHKAEAAGTLKNTPQQTVSDQNSTIVIQPAQPDIVYVPAYDPWVVYGPPLIAWPGWYPYPGIWYGGPFLSFGIGFGIGWFGGFGWGWGHWGFNWYNHSLLYHGAPWYSRSATFYNRNAFYHGGRSVAPGRGFGGDRYGGRGGVYNRPGASPRPFEGDRGAARGYAAPHGESGLHSGAFNGYDHGGESRSYSARGGQSMGGFHGGGFSGFHGGGFGGGGGFHGGGGGHH
jgi:Protein of unknown function (DUF3300)